MAEPELRLGMVGAGRFASFVADAVATLPSVSLDVVADQRADAASALAARHSARTASSWQQLLADDTVDVVVVATPPDTHATVAKAALEAGKHVFCEKPLAVDDAQARDLVATVETTRRVLVVDHVLRYNPLLRAIRRLRGTLLGPVQRFCFENDASDEDLGADHWFWDAARSGGVFLEHGVHFFDAAAMLIEQPASSVQAVAARRADGTVDLVSATVLHGDDTLASHTHSFTHAHRCERQLMRLDCGAAEVKVEGWIPVEAVIDVWTDDAGLSVADGLPARTRDLLHIDGFRPLPGTTLQIVRLPGSADARARGRGLDLDLPHHLRIKFTLGGHQAKTAVYAESVRAAMDDLVMRVADGGRPASGVDEGADAVAVAAAATRSARLGRVEPLMPVPVR